MKMKFEIKAMSSEKGGVVFNFEGGCLELEYEAGEIPEIIKARTQLVPALSEMFTNLISEVRPIVEKQLARDEEHFQRRMDLEEKKHELEYKQWAAKEAARAASTSEQ